MLRRLAAKGVLGRMATVMLGLAGRGLGAPSDAFLDRPLPDGVPTETRTVPAYDEDGAHRRIIVLGYTMFWSGVQLLGTLSGKAIRMPAALTEWPDERTEADFGCEAAAKAGAQTRRFVDDLCLRLNLAWSYDAATDTMDLRPAWWCEDPRSDQELLGILLGTRPADPQTLSQELAHWPGLGRPIRDPWRLAFDALPRC